METTATETKNIARGYAAAVFMNMKPYIDGPRIWELGGVQDATLNLCHIKQPTLKPEQH